MEDFTNVVEHFVNKKGYISDDNCEGVIFYGSRSTGFYNEQSDIDLQIIFNNHPLMRGVCTFEGYRFEFFEKTLGDLYGRANHDYHHQSNVMLSMIGNGITIFDRNGKIQELKEYVKKLYSYPLLPLTQVEDNEQVVIIANRLLDLKKLCLNNDPYFNRLYHLTIEKIRKYYYQRNGYPEISTSKVLELYGNPAYSEVIDKVMPSEEFKQMFFDSLDESKSYLEKYKLAEDMFNYAKLGNNLDLNNFLIPIKARNKEFKNL